MVDLMPVRPQTLLRKLEAMDRETLRQVFHRYLSTRCAAMLRHDAVCGAPAVRRFNGRVSLCDRHHGEVLEQVRLEAELAAERAAAERLPEVVTSVVARERSRRVYYVRRPDGPIKIGTTYSMGNRLRGLRNVAPVEVLAVHTGGHVAERALHRRFASSRLDGEWLAPTAELLAHIDHINRVRPVRGEDIGPRRKAS